MTWKNVVSDSIQYILIAVCCVWLGYTLLDFFIEQERNESYRECVAKSIKVTDCKGILNN